ncbi:hypothetical protein EVJ58_g7577 [Rhodofomes roseus]|uniref:DUF4218 domain-containing protein n=1 Tax=Rhodofomes roseus TaxID=34475 RepID=A0A4Y9Y282_9APHY|nr:hypothetical protein EVJ58_g7577 [Rhodofomes roseus]
MAYGKKKKLCLCSECGGFTHEVDGVKHPGLMLDPRKWKSHATEDALHQAQAEYEMNAVLLAHEAFGQPTDPHESLPTRPRDHEFRPSTPQPASAAQKETVYQTPHGSGAHDTDEDVHMASEASSPIPPSDPPLLSEDTEMFSEPVCSDSSNHGADDNLILRRLSELSLIESTLAIESRLLKNPKLSFVSPPTSLTDTPSALLPSSKDVMRFSQFRDWLSAKQRVLLCLPPLGHRDADSRRTKLISMISEWLDRLSSAEASSWEAEKIMAGLYRLPDQDTVGAPRVYDTAALHAVKRALPPFILAALLMVSALHTLSGLNREAANLVLATFRALLYGAFVICSRSNTPRGPSRLAVEHQAILDCIPRDIRSVMSHLKVEPQITRYASCPLCSCLYAPNEANHNNPYPHYCTFTDTDRPPCGAALVKKELRASTTSRSHASDKDVNLVFGLYLDWFNPGGNKKAGKSRSLGAMYLVCINLPPHLRFRPENICLVGIIPGPNEPSLHQLNHFLRPLVDEMLTLWHSGMWLTQTAVHAHGRLIRAAIIPLICDLPALRKAAGFAGHSSRHFCSFCLLKRPDINNISRPWPSRTWQEHLNIATQWRDAATERDRDTLFEEHGLRWSELLRLPYWDPTRYAVVDAMHNLFLGELRHHCMAIWGIDIKDHKDKHGRATDSTKTTPHTPDEQQQHITRLLNALRKAQLNAISPDKLTKREYAKALLLWCEAHGVDRLAIPPVLSTATADFHLANGPYDISKFRVLTADVIDQLRHDIKTTYLPSWIERPPVNFGSAAHGKLKADHWRTVCTISMVITLTRIWGNAASSNAERHLLKNFVHLVVAVDLASRRSMDPERARLFDQHMEEYLRTLQELFDQDLVPNNHLSLHLAACLLSFGPVHGWWAYPFERFNGIIQRLNTNNQIDKIPLTYMRIFHAAAELRWQVSSAEWPDDEGIREMLRAFDVVYRDAARGTRVIDILGTIPGSCPDIILEATYSSLSDSRLDRNIYNALLYVMNTAGLTRKFATFHSNADNNAILLSPFARFLPKLEVSGLTYGTRSGNIRNSFICFRDPSSHDPSVARAGQIAQLFLHSHINPQSNEQVVEPYVVVDQYEELSEDHARQDPYRRFPLLNTKLCYNRFTGTSVVIRVVDVIAHFAAFFYDPDGIGEGCVVVRSLDRVRHLI